MGRVITDYPSLRGVVRRVDVKTTNRNILHRAVNKLVPLLSEREHENNDPAELENIPIDEVQENLPVTTHQEIASSKQRATRPVTRSMTEAAFLEANV